MTSLERKAVVGFKRSLEREKKDLERDTALDRFSGITLNLKPLIQCHCDNIELYEKLIAKIERK